MRGVSASERGLDVANVVEGQDDGFAGVSGASLDQMSPEPSGTSSIA